MATVLLPVTRLSKKIILCEYGGEEPVVPGRADWLSDQLRIDRSDTGFAASVLDALTAGLLLDVPPRLADHIARDGARVGAVLHRLHVEQLTKHMLSAVIMGGEAKKAMRAFYDIYGIDDDDIDEQSVYREYGRFSRRFFQKISARSGTKSTSAVRPESRIWQGISEEKERITNATLNALCEILTDRLQRCRIRRLKRLTRQAHIYIWARRGRRRWDEIGKRFGIRRSSVYRALKSIRMRIRDDKRFARAILPLLDASFVLPDPKPSGHLCTTPPAAPAILDQEPQISNTL